MRLLAIVSTFLLLGAAFAQKPDADTLVLAQTRGAASLDPAAIGDTGTMNIVRGMVFGTLVDIDENGQLQMNLAESVAVSEDGTEISYTLHEGLTCEDGEPLTAEDVVYSIQRAADPANGFTGNIVNFVFPNIAYVDARVDGPLVATIVTSEYNPAAVQFTADIMIHCKDSYEKMSLDQAANTTVASGPYRIVENVRGERTVLQKRDDYTLAPGTWQQIVWRTIPEASTRAAELIAGNIDIATDIVSEHQAAINDSGAAEVIAVIGTRRIAAWFSFNQKLAETDPGTAAIQSSAVRRALQYAIDVPAICENLLGVECQRMTTLVNPPNDNPNLQPYPYDPEMAEKLLDEAGYPRNANGVRFELKLQTGNGAFPNDVNVGLVVAQYLTDIGVATEVESMESTSVFTPLVRSHGAGPLFLNSIGGGTWSALRDMGAYMTYDTNNNYNDWNNEEWFALYQKLIAERDADARQLIVNDMLQIFYNDPPWLMLYFLPNFYGVSERLDWTPRRDGQIDPLTATIKTQ